MLAGGAVGTPGGLQRLVFVVRGAVAFMAEEAVFESVLVRDVGASAGSELSELVCAVRVRVE